MTTDLIPLENPEPGALFAPAGLETILVRIEAEARALVPDIATVKGRAAVASLAAKVAKAKTQQEREDRIAREAAERATREAQRAERDIALAKAREAAAAQLERDRAAAEAMAKADADAKRATDQAHRERIHAEIATDLGYLSIPGVPSLVESIAAGRIRHLTINY